MRLAVAAAASTVCLLAVHPGGTKAEPAEVGAALSASWAVQVGKGMRRVGGLSTSLYAIRLAASSYRVSYTDMVSVARCESRLDPRARNPSSGAAGLFQFLPSTWANQGLAGFSVYDPAANALATARIVSREGWRQWSCRP